LPYGALSGRELEMLGFLAQGRTNREIAAVLSLSLATVKTHLVRLYSKLGVGSRSEALARAAALGLLR
jgi:ATP/maltotriose-dependent transcriptional regulator MalT